MENYRDVWLPPFPLNLRQKPKTKALWAFSPASRAPTAERLVQHIHGRDRTSVHNSVDPSVILSYVKLTNPKLGEENPPEVLKTPSLQREAWLYMCFLTPHKSLSSTSNSVSEGSSPPLSPHNRQGWCWPTHCHLSLQWFSLSLLRGSFLFKFVYGFSTNV